MAREESCWGRWLRTYEARHGGVTAGSIRRWRKMRRCGGTSLPVDAYALLFGTPDLGRRDNCGAGLGSPERSAALSVAGPGSVAAKAEVKGGSQSGPEGDRNGSLEAGGADACDGREGQRLRHRVGSGIEARVLIFLCICIVSGGLDTY
ncbi:vegetative cell wall protein gp1-like [Iris pallida]|uniref:Vegetative cell wall protein gp1-like n=1 Tax=Iris pallida TaxID=29817 RepID=A0AAX6IH25_IRIPA|nr:vegetative cell wall protein gp1-like [Iris pallida]